MGMYIDNDTTGKALDPHEKSAHLTEQYGKLGHADISMGTGVRIDGKVLVCVVDNGAFQAALICVNLRDLAAVLNMQDTRPKTFHLVPEEDIRKMNPYALWQKNSDDDDLPF